MPEMLQGAFVTLHVSVLAMLIGIVFAVLLAIAKMNNVKVFSQIAIGWVEIARNTPDRKSTRLNSSHITISYAGLCLKKKTKETSLVPQPLVT